MHASNNILDVSLDFAWRKKKKKEELSLGVLYLEYILIFFLPRIAEIELLSQHGVMLPPNMQGLTEEQVTELKLKDEFAEVCTPSGGSVDNPDPVGRRNGRGKLLHSYPCRNAVLSVALYAAPNDKMKDVLKRTVSEAKSATSKVTHTVYSDQVM